MKRRLIIICSVFGLCLSVTGVYAQSQSSSNFENAQSSFVPATFDTNSSNFQINGSLEVLVGDSQSGSFSSQSGVPFVSGGSQPSGGSSGGSGGGSGSSGGGGGGLSQGTALNPTLEFHSPTFFSHQLVQGLRGSPSDAIFVNGSSNGVVLVDDQHWNRDLPLFLGKNTVFVQSRQSNGALSQVIMADIVRWLVGDINKDRVVDDADLSLFTRAWRQYTPSADFNEDHHIDDQDLSLFASHWGWIASSL